MENHLFRDIVRRCKNCQSSYYVKYTAEADYCSRNCQTSATWLKVCKQNTAARRAEQVEKDRGDGLVHGKEKKKDVDKILENVKPQI